LKTGARRNYQQLSVIYKARENCKHCRRLKKNTNFSALHGAQWKFDFGVSFMR